MLVLAAALAASSPAQDAVEPVPKTNFLLITADDLNWDSVGAYGCKVADVSPNIDALAKAGMRFERAHVTIAVCQPCRSVLMTGRYPHRNGARGFEPIRAGVPTLSGVLGNAGYYVGILGKTKHLAPAKQFAWDVQVPQTELGVGRDPERYHASVTRFLKTAKERKQPFFLMANSHDPHRPFAGSAQEKNQRRRRKKAFPPVAEAYAPKDIVVPGFLPDLPPVRRELAQYFTSVRRLDRTVGRILAALDESGLADDTVVIFLSDHGMPLPFAKTNVYLNSTKVPWIVRWPGKVRPAIVDSKHFVSGIDFMPTVLEIAGVVAPEGMDGRSFLPLLKGEKQDGRDEVLTVFHRTSGRRAYPMRCLQTGRFGYIRNAWSDGKKVFRNESQAGLTFRAMRRAGAQDPKIAARVKLFQYRVPEELYDFAKDPDALHNLVGDEKYAEVVARMRRRMLAILAQTGDPDRALFEK